MEKIGNYTIESELSGGAHVSIYSARHESKPSGNPVCLKVWRRLSESDYSEDIGHLFLESANLQGELAGKCPKTWVQILDSGSDESGHYIVTPIYKETLARGLGTIAADGMLLNAVLESVLNALEDLEKHNSRCHGNLKPSKILMEGSGAISNRKLRLNELSPVELIDTSLYKNPDLRGLGELIFMLASRTSSVNQSMRNVPAHAEWPRLGNQEQQWKDLCSELLNPTGRFQTEGLGALRDELNKFAKVKQKSSKPIFIAAAAAISALAVGSFLFIKSRPEPIDLAITDQYVDYVSAYEDWLKDFASSFQRRRSMIEGDPYLSETIAGLIKKRGEAIIPAEAFQMLLPSDPTVFPEALNVDRRFQRRVTDAYRFLLEFEKALEAWPVRQDVLEQVGKLRGLGLEGPASELENMAGNFQYDDRLFDQLMDITESRSLANDVMSSWSEINALHESLRSLNDPYLKQIPQWQLAQLQESDISLSNFMNRISDQMGILRPIQEIIEIPDWTNQYAYDLFLESLNQGEAQLTGIADIENWVKLMGEFRRIPDPRETENPLISGAMDQIQSKISQLSNYGLNNDANAFSEELNVLNGALDGIASIPAIQKELTRLNEALRNQKNNLEELNKRVSELISKNIIDPAEWLQKWKSEQLPISSIVAESWTRNRNSIIEKESVTSLKGRQAEMYELDLKLSHFRDLLIGVDQALPAPQLSGDVRSAEMDFRLEPYIQGLHQESLRSILSEMPAILKAADLELQAFLNSQAVTAISERYNSQLASASEFSANFFQYGREMVAPTPPSQAFYEFIDKEIISSDGWISRIGANPDDVPVLDTLVKIAATRSLESSDQLFSIIGDRRIAMGNKWTAWNRLLALGIVPTTSDQWAEWTSLFENFRGQLPDELHPVLNGADLWARGASSASDFEVLRSALTVRSVFEGDISGLSENARFIHFLLEQREFLSGDRSMFTAGGASVLAWKESMLETLNESFAGSELEFIQSFKERVQSINPDEVTEEVDLSRVALGSLDGWELLPISDEGVVTYRWEQFDLSFRSVDDGSGNLTYVCTIEVPVGMVVQWYMDYPEFLDQVREEITANQAGVESRQGPQTWLTDFDGQPDLVFNWLSLSPRWELKHYATPPRNSKPVDEHPMQYVSPQLSQAIAQSLNCRLLRPTEYETILKSVPNNFPGWNRRDQTWLNHRTHISTTNSTMLSSDPPWPENGIFIPDGLTVERAGSAEAAVTYDDENLWFSEVYESKEEVPFLHLVGNVAEYAYDAESDQYFVMGASALSPAEVIPATPYPVALDSAKSGFADVGFRLAFDLPQNTPGAMLARIVLDSQFAEDLFPPK